MTSIPTAPILGHVEGVELMETGTWLAMSGEATFTPDNIASAVAALDCPAVRRPVLKAGHGGAHGVGEPALGYVANLRTSNEGQTLVGDYRGMPGWLTAVDDDGQSVLASAYSDRSIEAEWDYRCQIGHVHPFVVHAVALLGVERPAIGTLESLQELYGLVAAATASVGGQLVTFTVQPQEAPVPQPPEPQRISASATTDDVRRAYYSSPEGSDWDLWIREMYVDPPELIVDNDADGSILRVPYTVTGDDVTFGEPQAVKVTYVAARAASGEPTVRFADRAASRPGDRPAASSAAPQAPVATASGSTTPGEEPAVVFTDEQLTTLRQQLGLPEDADAATILAAQSEALAERAEPESQTSSEVPEGMSLIDNGVLQDLQTAASAGREAREQQLTERREALVDAAVRDGRLAPAQREGWITKLSTDTGSEDILAKLAKGLVPLQFAGTAGSPEASAADANYRSLFPDEFANDKAGV